MPLRILWRRVRALAGIALALALVGLLAWIFVANWRPSRSAFPVQGIDVGFAQGEIDWFRVKANPEVGFAYIRASVGADRNDRHFPINWRGAYAAGVPRGAIHVFSLCQLAADQAGHFFELVEDSSDQLPMAVDLDFRPDCTARPTREVVLIELGNFLRAIEDHRREPAILRVSPAFEERYRISAGFDRPLWSTGAFFVPGYSDRPWMLWQASRFRRIDGIEKPANWNVRAP